MVLKGFSERFRLYEVRWQGSNVPPERSNEQ
jgi:hypothetical protein